jgi:uncharacterized SAM-binding protein YcdF (DUF218 family)
LFKVLGFFTCLSISGLTLGLYFAGSWLVVKQAPVKSDAMVLLSGDLSRPLYGADLYNEGYAPVIYVGRPKPYEQVPNVEKLGIHFPRNEELYQEILFKKKVPRKAVRLYGNQYVSTVEEAESLKEVIGDKPMKLLVVTSPYHLRRAQSVFEKTLPNAQIHVVASPYEKFVEKWWTDQTSAANVVLEAAKLVHYRLGGAFRSTDERVRASAGAGG